jgi:hypothetical protein
MIDHVDWVQVIDSSVRDKSDFTWSSPYYLSPEAGSLELLEHTLGFAYKNPAKSKLFYARASTHGSRIFTQSRLIDGWADERELPPVVNHGTDNAFPFLLEDGVTLYYASTPDYALGGYDLFVTRYNTSTASYLVPEQLPMPFNSVFNDYFIAFDEAKGLGWFVSDRYQPEGKVCLYLFILENGTHPPPSASPEDKLAHAELRSIRDTWHHPANYNKLISLARQHPSPTPPDAPTPDDDYDYRALCLHVQELRTALDNLRLEFKHADPDRKEELRNTILTDERYLEHLIPLIKPYTLTRVLR